MSLFNKAVAFMSPSGYGDAELFGQLPESTDDFDFTVDRAAFSTRVNGTQYLQNMLPDYPLLSYAGGRTCPTLLTQPQRTRLTTYPISFDNAAWTKSGSTVDDNGGAGYNAPMLEPNLGSELVTNGDMELDANWVDFGTPTTNERSSEQAYAGTYSRKFVGDAGSDGIQQTGITTVVGGVYLIEAYCYLSASTAISVKCDFQTSGGSADGTTNAITTTGSWQLMTAYITATTTSSKIVFYQSGAGATTVYVDNVSVKQILATASTTPMTKAYKLVEDGSASTTHKVLGSVTGLTSTGEFTFSVYAKSGERNWIVMYEGTSNEGQYFDLDNGVEGAVHAGTPNSSSITALVDGWYMCTITVNIAATTFQPYVYLADSDGGITYSGDGTSGAYIFFAQLEEGAYPTTPIYNGSEGATLTRLGDAITDGGDATLFSGVNSSGVLYAKMAALADDGTIRVIMLSDAAQDNYVFLRYDVTSNQIKASVAVDGETVVILDKVVSDVTDFNKVAVSWKNGEQSLWINGTKEDTETNAWTFSASALETMKLRTTAGSIFYGKLDEYGVYEYLTDAEMITLTT